MVDPISGQTGVTPGSAQPDTASTAQATEPQSQEQKPLDEARVIELATQIASRTAQSLVDKAEYRISRKAQEQIQALELNQSVLGLNDQQVLDAKQKIVMNDLTAKQQDPQPSEPPVSNVAPAEDAVASFVNSIFDTVGTRVTPQDPQWKELQTVIDENWNNPKGYVQVMMAATKAAQEKLAAKNSNSETASARVFGSGGQGQSTGTPDAPASDLWKQAYKK